MAMLQLTADLQIIEGGRIQAQLVELPDVIASTPIHDQLPAQLADALAEYLRSLGPATLPPMPDEATRVPIILTLSI